MRSTAYGKTAYQDLDSQTPVSGSVHVDFCLSIGFVDKELLND